MVRVSVTGGESLRESSPSKETPEEKTMPLSESVTDAFEIDSFSSSTELVSEDLELATPPPQLPLYFPMARNCSGYLSWAYTHWSSGNSCHIACTSLEAKAFFLGPTVQHDGLSCLLHSHTESYAESTEESEESGSSFPSPELFRGSDCLDWEHPKLEDCILYKNSTLLDTSKAVAVEKVPQFANLSAVLNSSSENYERCHRKIECSDCWNTYRKESNQLNTKTAARSKSILLCGEVDIRWGMTLAAQHISPEPKYTSNLASENVASEVVFAEKTGPPTAEKTKKKEHYLGFLAPFYPSPDPCWPNLSLIKPHFQPYRTQCESYYLKCEPENKPEDRGPLVQTKLSSGHPDSKALCSPVSSALENNAVRDALLPQPLEPVLKKGCILPDNQSKALLTSTPSSDIAEFVFSPNTSEICCIIRASPGTRQMRRKDIAVQNRCSLPKDVPLVYYNEDKWQNITAVAEFSLL
ncbi:Meiosis-specific kinetochore protein [Apodemus speciosus]|uniref:Meiosis-specific kinetochore protein n=1 Tax=Apodemus speciosus TaxID=105296 RepID=A0ABQ0FA00_APOSI